MRNNSVDVSKAFAISSVFLYHLSPQIFKSGFLGVDVFLVVTGYLSAMTLSKTDSYSFLKGRLKRIYPSLSMLIVLCFVGILSIGYYSEVYGFLKYAISSSFLLNNYHLYLDNGYFAQDVYSNLLFHLWSISLEFQSWIVLAVFAYCVALSRLLYILGGLSLVIAFYILNVGDMNSFYLLTPFRFWEVVLGVAAYNVGRRMDVRYSNVFVSLVVVVWSALMFVDIKKYWCLWPLAPLLTVIVLTFEVKFGGFCAYISKYLSERTYSIYLWHVPIICVVYYYFAVTGLLGVLVVVTITLLASECNYRYIEK